MNLLITFLFTILTTHSLAGVDAFTSSSMQKLFIEEAPAIGKDSFLVKFTGVSSPWSENVILTKKNATTGNHYEFEYKLELSSGIKTRTYSMITEAGKTLVNGSSVRKVKLWTSSGPKEGIEFTWDKDLTSQSQQIDLLSQHKKKAFTPEVD
jgi:hypothetical protein